jgi:mono/diheme cytochrome c family protein
MRHSCRFSHCGRSTNGTSDSCKTHLSDITTITNRDRQRGGARFGTIPALAVLGGAVFAVVSSYSPDGSQLHQARVMAVEATPPVASEPTEAVKALFANHCSSCHGAAGDGLGAGAYLLSPKPRDFTSGIFRFKSTPGDQPPTMADVTRVIAQGIERTAMPGFAGILDDSQINGLARLVLQLAGTAGGAPASASVEIPARPAFTPELVKQGQMLYVGAGCGACHGETGRGDGPSSASLKDSQGYPLPAADFTMGVFKAGRTPEDLFRTIVVGVPGTPMPSYAAGLEKIDVPMSGSSSDRAWALVAYLQSIKSKREPEGVKSAVTVKPSKLTDEAMLADSGHKGWGALAATRVSLQPLWQRAQAARSIAIRAVRTDKLVAIHLEWPDAHPDPEPGATHTNVSDFTDAAAVMFSMTDQVPPLTMGQSKPNEHGGVTAEQMVNVWHWKASRQLHADAGTLRDVPAGVDGGMPADMYMFKKNELKAGPLSEHDPTFISAWGSGNPQTDPALLSRPVLESNAAQFGTMTLQPPAAQHVRGQGRWADGVWRVVMVRDLDTADEADAPLAKLQRVPFAVAAWDGAAGDRNGTKLITSWHWLELQ